VIGLGTLQRYVARRFLVAFLGAFMLCVTLIFMIDMVELLRESGKFGAISGWTIAYMALLRLPVMTEITLPFVVLVGTISAFLLLSRGSELTVLRASGMAVWQFIRPGVMVAFLIGVLSVTAYNPLAAWCRGKADHLFAISFGRDDSLMSRTKESGQWLRQDGRDGPSILNARSASNRGRLLGSVTIIQYDREERFVEYIAARSATLREGFWELEDAVITRGGSERPESHKQLLVSTYLTPERVMDAIGAVTTISFWQLPDFIELAEKAGLNPSSYKVQYALFWSRPFLLVAMVLMGATVSLRSFRFGGIQGLVVTGLVAGFVFFIAVEVSRQVGVAGLVSPHAAAWVPVFMGIFASLTVLLHQEDG
jgi:lipopolysaccharide export system permease protein